MKTNKSDAIIPALITLPLVIFIVFATGWTFSDWKFWVFALFFSATISALQERSLAIANRETVASAKHVKENVKENDNDHF